MTQTTEHEKVMATPDGFIVFCPNCGDCLQVVLDEQPDGGYEPDPSEMFQQCDCGQLLEITGRWRNLP